MKNFRKIRFAGLALVAVVALPLAALASHGKAGLWKITTAMHMGGMQMPQLSPEQMAQMKAMGMHIPTGNTITTQHCMTEAEVKGDSVPYKQQANSGCKTTNVKAVGDSMSADTVCNGEMKGQGHFTMSWDSADHYRGTVTFKGITHGHPVDSSSSFDGQWISADCGKVRNRWRMHAMLPV